MALAYLGMLSLYWLWTVAHFLADAAHMREVQAFVTHKLGISDRALVMMTWAEVARRLVLVQRTLRLSITRDLNELDIIARIMRKVL